MSKRFVALFLMVGFATPFAGRGEGNDDAPTVTRPVRPVKKVIEFTPEREAAARVFVQRRHPELDSLLDHLKTRNRPEYEKAVVELFQVSEDLATLHQQDPERHELALNAWKAKSRVEVLTAQLARGPTPELESQLRRAIESQIRADIQKHRFERDQAKARLRRAEETLERLERERGALVDSRYEALLKKARGKRRGDGAIAAPTTTKPAGRAKTMGDGAR